MKGKKLSKHCSILYHINIEGSYSKIAASERWDEHLGHTMAMHPEVLFKLEVEGIGGIRSAKKVVG